jgi:hypothetical protein
MSEVLEKKWYVVRAVSGEQDKGIHRNRSWKTWF